MAICWLHPQYRLISTALSEALKSRRKLGNVGFGQPAIGRWDKIQAISGHKHNPGHVANPATAARHTLILLQFPSSEEGTLAGTNFSNQPSWKDGSLWPLVVRFLLCLAGLGCPHVPRPSTPPERANAVKSSSRPSHGPGSGAGI